MFLGSEVVSISLEASAGIVASRARVAASLWLRLKGLLGTASLPDGEALIIAPCTSVHMLFMRYPIDVLFCSADGVVLRICSELKPWRFSPFVLGAYCAIELPSGTSSKLGIEIGDKLLFSPIKLH